MPPVVFKKPPLVEIAAELRWQLANVKGLPADLSRAPLPVDASSHEVQFMNFAGKAGEKGFSFVERIIPPGFPMLANQVAFRYRNRTISSGAPLYQLGPGIFTISMVPPYKSWDAFRPYIDLGIALLFDSWEQKDRPNFSSVRLRYTDAFSDEMRQGLSSVEFLSEKLGIGILLPESVKKFCNDAQGIKPNISATIPIQRGTLELRVSEGWIRNMRSLIMGTSVSMGDSFNTRSSLLEAFDAAHQVIHEVFVDMTRPLHALMQPDAGGQ
jgi:uncharacterized protein (TIGR04255 family)